jgi:putative N6-adenine-specific DNA methylase
MCGSGTLLIEGGLIAARRAPGLYRRYAVERWPSLGEMARGTIRELKDAARASERPVSAPILGFDKDEDALAAARRNLQAAKLHNSVQLQVHDALTPLPSSLPPTGLMVTNPPYGDRLGAGSRKGMKGFYFKLGESLAVLDGWRMAVLAGNPDFESAFHRKPSSRRVLWNGPIECRLLTYEPKPRVG